MRAEITLVFSMLPVVSATVFATPFIIIGGKLPPIIHPKSKTINMDF